MNTTQRHNSRKPRHPPRPSFQPQLEQLENRCLLAVTLLPQTPVNTGHLDGQQYEATVAVDPTNLNRLFVASNSSDGSGKMYDSYSSDGGQTWTSGKFGTGSDGLPPSYCDAQAVFDQFGNLFMTYI